MRSSGTALAEAAPCSRETRGRLCAPMASAPRGLAHPLLQGCGLRGCSLNVVRTTSHSHPSYLRAATCRQAMLQTQDDGIASKAPRSPPIGGERRGRPSAPGPRVHAMSWNSSATVTRAKCFRQ